MDRAKDSAAQELPAKGKYPRDGEATHGGLVMQSGRSTERHAGTRAKVIPSVDASAQQPAAAEPAWEEVERYFPGLECDKCPYMRGYQSEGVLWAHCGLLETWKGLGRAPEPTDCRGVEKQMEEAA